MNTVNSSFSGEVPSPNQMKKYLETRMEQLARENICLVLSDEIDSSLFLKTAANAATHMRRKICAVAFDNRLHPSYDLEITRRVTRELGGVHEVITVSGLEQKSMKNNPVNRRYLCRRHLFSRLIELAEARGIRYILDSINEDDMCVYRPGIRALKEPGIIGPLTELHVTRVRAEALAPEYGISVASRPSAPYVTTRLPRDAALDYEVLRRIGGGETYVGTMVPGNVHLRLHGDIMRLELNPEAFKISIKGRKGIVSRLKEMGFVYITLDAEGFRPGNMDAGLNEPEVQ